MMDTVPSRGPTAGSAGASVVRYPVMVAAGLVAALWTLHVAAATLALRGLYGDGAHWLTAVLVRADTPSLYVEPLGRLLANVMLQSLVMLGHDLLGIDDVRVLGMLWTFPQVVHAPLSLMLCWWILRRAEKPALFVFPLVSMAAFQLISSLFSVDPGLLLASLAWPLFLLVAAVDRPTRLDAALALGLAAATVYTHESAVFFAPLIVAACTLAWWRGQWSERLRTLGLVALIELGAFALAVHALMTAPPVISGRWSSHLMHSLIPLTIPHALGVCVVLGVLAAPLAGGWTSARDGRDRLPTALLAMGTVGIAALTVLGLIGYRLFPEADYMRRSVAVLGAAGCIGALGVVLLVPSLRRLFLIPPRRMLMVALLGLAGQLAWQVTSTLHWVRYVAEVDGAVRDGDGVVIADDIGLLDPAEPAHRFAVDFALPGLSVLVQAMRDDEPVHAIVVTRHVLARHNVFPRTPDGVLNFGRGFVTVDGTFRFGPFLDSFRQQARSGLFDNLERTPSPHDDGTIPEADGSVPGEPALQVPDDGTPRPVRAPRRAPLLATVP